VINQLRETLSALCSQSGNDFSGAGVIIYKDLTGIPVYPLRDTYPKLQHLDLLDQLLHISPIDSPYHDGFHLVSKSLKITHYSQYFSPPIVQGLAVKKNRAFGGRYMAALFGSCLDNVEAIGIACTDKSIAIFESGIETHYEIIQ